MVRNETATFDVIDTCRGKMACVRRLDNSA